MPEESVDTFALASRRVVRFGVIYAAVVAIASALGFAGYSAIRAGLADPTDVSTQASVLIVGAIAGLVGLVCVLGLLISAVVWVISAHRLDPAGPGAAGYAGLVLWLLLTGSAYVVPRQVHALGGSVATEAVLRIGGIVALVAAVLAMRARVRRQTGRPDLAGRPRTLLTDDDWDASKWDPEVLRDIERRRGSA